MYGFGSESKVYSIYAFFLSNQVADEGMYIGNEFTYRSSYCCGSAQGPADAMFVVRI